jgi:hypothetical protein
MVLSIRVRLRTEMFATVTVFRSGQTVPNTRVTGEVESLVAEEYSITLTAMSMMVRYLF